jgi:4'-phosphopantetheinyl transferase
LYLLWANLDAPPLPFRTLADVLSPTERERARRFADQRLRERWVVGRGVLRHCLGRLLGVEPRALPLAQSPRGKPFVAGGPAFNLSHTGPHLLVAISPAGRVGVDAQECRPFADQEALLRQFFATGEAEEILALPHAPSGSERNAAFFRAWVRKEALVKAIGTGVGTPWKCFEVSHEAGAANALRCLRLPPEQFQHWRIRAVAAPDGVEAAVAWDRPELVPQVIAWRAAE